MNCPKCGAPELEGTQPADASSRFFKCGTVCDRGIVTASWPCKELCELRSKLTPEGAEPLKWTQVSRYRIKSDCELLKLEIIFHNNGEAVLVGNVSTNRWHETIAAAFNAVTSDDSPITAEWLLANGYKRYRDYDVYELDRIRVWMPGGPTVYCNDSKIPTKTIGQLRALHAGLGIGEVGK